MVGFLKSRSLKNAAARGEAGANANPPASPAATTTGVGERANAAVTIVAGAPTNPVAPPDRYVIREVADGCSIHDTQTGDTAETYGYRLTKMSRTRAESLVAVLNRAEARKQGRNG